MKGTHWIFLVQSAGCGSRLKKKDLYVKEGAAVTTKRLSQIGRE